MRLPIRGVEGGHEGTDRVEKKVFDFEKQLRAMQRGPGLPTDRGQQFHFVFLKRPLGADPIRVQGSQTLGLRFQRNANHRRGSVFFLLAICVWNG